MNRFLWPLVVVIGLLVFLVMGLRHGDPRALPSPFIGKPAPRFELPSLFNPDEKISKVVSKIFDFRPAAITETLDLLRPIYAPTAAYGHFGRTEKPFTWDRTDRAEELKKALLPKRSR